MKFKSSPLARYWEHRTLIPHISCCLRFAKSFSLSEVPDNLMYSYFLTGVCLIRGINVLFYTDLLCNDSKFEIWIYAENWFYWGTDKLSALSSTSLPSSFSWTCRTQRISHQTCQSCKSIYWLSQNILKLWQSLVSTDNGIAYTSMLERTSSCGGEE